ncbi:hypothetical protein LINPERPRIM_LOCUS603 [Linum perenne]
MTCALPMVEQWEEIYDPLAVTDVDSRRQIPFGFRRFFHQLPSCLLPPGFVDARSRPPPPAETSDDDGCGGKMKKNTKEKKKNKKILELIRIKSTAEINHD